MIAPGDWVMDVYRGFDQATLDREYTPSSCVESLEPFLREYAGRSAAAREKLAWRSVAYGLTEAETVDFFPAPAPMAPLHIFIHGGYWRQLSKRESSFAAEQFVAAGAAFAAVDYALAPGVTLDEIVRQVRSAVAFLYAEADALGVDRERIYVSGSSAGGHLTGMVMATDWQGLFGLPNDVVKGGTVISGVMDLAPVRLSLVNGWMNLDEAAAWRNSPQRLAPHPGTSVIVAVGDIETGEFKRQSADYAAMCRAAGLACEDFVVPARNHFDVVFDLGDASTMLGAAVRRQMFG
jgi:arylformamidase